MDSESRPASRDSACVSFQLTRESEQSRLVAEAADDLGPNRETLLVPVERDRHGRLPGGVEHRGERNG